VTRAAQDDGWVAELTPARLRAADALVFANTSGELPLGPRKKRALLRFLRHSGKGFIGTHSASDTLYTWPTYEQLLGGQFMSHPNVGEGRVIVEDRAHPATRRLGGSFRIREEFYYFQENPRPRAHVLARLDVGSFGGDPGEDRPLVWCRREGRGRVFYNALGHFQETWSNGRQRAITKGALNWALGLDRAPCG